MYDDIDTFIIGDEEADDRLDKILAKRLVHAGSRTYFQFLIQEGKVLVNGLPIKKRYKPRSGDEIEIEYILTPELNLHPENIPLTILYEDEDLLVVNKASGMVVHPAPGHWSGTFVNALLFHCRDFQENLCEKSLRPGIVHRLDKDTTGLLLGAKTSIAQNRLIEMFANRRIYKEYLAVCVGNPGSGVIDQPIGRHPFHRKLMAVLEQGGRSALTEFRTLDFDDKLSLVNLVIATGRTHQIRVHMKHLRTPILGDALYGIATLNAKYGIHRQLLHAYRLRFTHPISGIPLSFQAEIPHDMQQVASRFSRFNPTKGVNIP